MSEQDVTTDRGQLRAELPQSSSRMAVPGCQTDTVTWRASPCHGGDVLRTVMADVPIILFSVDISGTITLSEGKGLEGLGLKPGQFVGKSIFDTYGEIPGLADYFCRALRGEVKSKTVQLGGVVIETLHTPLRSSHGEPIGVAGIAIDVTEHCRIEEQLRGERRLMKQMLLSHERDRRLIAYEVHDGLVQYAAAAQMNLDAVLQDDRLPPGPARDQVRTACELIGRSIGEARVLISGLRPPVLDELGVVAAIESLIEGQQAEALSIEFTEQVQFDRLEPLLEGTIYRIAQEAITNVRRHSQSQRAEVRLTQVGDRVHLEIQDWGVGFEPAQVAENRFGLQGIHERARLLRGRALIESAPGKGTRVFVDLPLAPALAVQQTQPFGEPIV